MQSKLQEDENHLLKTSAAECFYTKCYCEENVWLLCDEACKRWKDGADEFYVLFISNDNKCIPIWRQRGSTEQDQMVLWDYHVILFQHHKLNKGKGSSWIYDLDTSLSFPCDAVEYFQVAIRSDDFIVPEYHRKLRVIPVQKYLKHFASDRSHMLKEDGSYQSPPPEYEAIKTSEETMNLHQYIDMKNNTEKFGNVFSVNEFIAKYIPDYKT